MLHIYRSMCKFTAICKVCMYASKRALTLIKEKILLQEKRHLNWASFEWISGLQILGLNCLCTAYILSVQYLDGVKLGDTQATCHGILTAMLFLFLSHAKPLPILCSDRPYTSIFCPYWFLSVLGQFAVHLTFLITGVNGAVAYMPKDVRVQFSACSSWNRTRIPFASHFCRLAR